MPNLIRSAITHGRELVHGRAPDADVFFMHIPKCGGGSIHDAIKRCYVGRKPVYWLSPWSATKAAELTGREDLSIRRELLCYQMTNQRDGYIGGHYPFSRAACDEYGERWAHITVLRDPVDRWYSHYFYNRYKTHSEYSRVDEPLKEFVLTDRARAWGRQYTHFLSERRDTVEALENVERFAVVGVLEELPTFVKDCADKLDLKLLINHQNHSPARDDQREEITNGIDEQVHWICAPDMELYHKAVRLAGAVGRPQLRRHTRDESAACPQHL